MPPEDLAKLKKAIDGLTYPSESDEPFDVVIWDANGTAADQVAAHAAKDRPIEPVPFEKFFEQLQDSEDVARYQQLRQVMASLLHDLTAFRVGQGDVRVDVFVIGKSRSGDWCGLHTVSVET
jgi:hypothetical protein